MGKLHFHRSSVVPPKTQAEPDALIASHIHTYAPATARWLLRSVLCRLYALDVLRD